MSNDQTGKLLRRMAKKGRSSLSRILGSPQTQPQTQPQAAPTATAPHRDLSVLRRRLFDPDVIERMNARSTLLILTHQKAGTHYIRFFLANYLLLLRDPEADPVNDKRLNELMPNVRLYLEDGQRTYKDPEPFSEHGISEVMFSHVDDKVSRATDEHHLGKKILSVRNPLDFLVSIWHYNYKNRKEEEKRNKPIGEVLDREIRKYALQVNYLRRLEESRPADTFATTYEALMTNGQQEFTSMLEFVGLPLHDDCVTKALERSSFDAVRKMEERRGRAIVAPIRGFFTRSGKIGQWRDHLTDEQVTRVSEILREYELSLDEFALDDPTA